MGESWELVSFGEYDSEVTSGPRAGERLGALWQSGALGGSAAGSFPFLLKWLDVHDYLSVQVHPDEVACEAIEGASPKTECWVVVHKEPEALLLAGHRAGLDAPTLLKACESGSVRRWMHEISPQPGEIVFVPAGTMHAIGPGFLLLEVQQPSDSTFRMHDWGRMGLDGKPRALHLDEAIASLHFDRTEPLVPTSQPVRGPGFEVGLLQGQTLSSEDLRVVAAGLSELVVECDGGSLALAPGDVAVMEQSDGNCVVRGQGGVLIGEAKAGRDQP